jgi:hypothetical protein
MKITYVRTGVVETNFKDEWDLEISPDTLAQIKSGQHPDYDSVEEWVEDNWSGNEPATRSYTGPDEVYEGDTQILEAAE